MLILETKNKIVNLVLKTKKIIDIVIKTGSKNFEEYFFKVMYNKDLKGLSEIIYTLNENEDGSKIFSSSTCVYDFIDDYKYEKNKTYDDIFNELADFINNEGFFNKKMSREELEEKKGNLMTSMDMEKVMDSVLKDVSKEVATEIAQEKLQDKKNPDMFMGYKA